MKKIILFLAGSLLLNIVYAQKNDPINWDTDLDYIATELPQRHYDLYSEKSQDYFLNGLENIKENSKNLTDLEVALKVQQLIAGLGDSHTRINFSAMLDSDQILPLGLYWFSDGLFILHTIHENKEILGHKIISVNNVATEIISDSLGSLISVDNQAILKSFAPMYIPVIQILKFFGFTDNDKKIKLELESISGEKKTYNIEPANMDRNSRETYMPDLIPLCYKNEKIFFIDYYQPDDKIYYLQYNRCWSKELELQYGNKENAEKMPSFNEFEDRVFNILEKEPIDKIVVDLRFNGGGNSIQGTKFIEKLAGYLKKNNKIKLYVVLGRVTFSSAILNAMDFERLTNAVFIGEETAGKPNHFGEVKSFQLPTSGLYVYYSTKYFKRTDENVSSLTPEIQLETSFSDFTKGIDPVYEWIKNQ